MSTVSCASENRNNSRSVSAKEEDAPLERHVLFLATTAYGGFDLPATEWVIFTPKQEWLRRVQVIRALDHLSQLLRDFEIYYNEYRGHGTLGGAVPSLIHRGEQWAKPEKSAKKLPPNVERRVFLETRVTAYRLAA